MKNFKKFKKYVNNNRNDITFKTFFIHKAKCNQILNSFLTGRNILDLYLLKEMVVFYRELYILVSKNDGTMEDLLVIKESYTYFKNWIQNQSDFKINENIYGKI